MGNSSPDLAAIPPAAEVTAEQAPPAAEEPPIEWAIRTNLASLTSDQRVDFFLILERFGFLAGKKDNFSQLTYRHFVRIGNQHPDPKNHWKNLAILQELMRADGIDPDALRSRQPDLMWDNS